MIADGFTREVQSLLDRRYDETLKPMQSMGYKHMVHYIQGICSLQEAVRLMKRDTRHYAKIQMTWCGTDREMTWFFPGDFDALREKVDAFLSR